MRKCIKMKHYPEGSFSLQVQFKSTCQINSSTEVSKILKNEIAEEVFPSVRKKPQLLCPQCPHFQLRVQCLCNLLLNRKLNEKLALNKSEFN